MKRHLWGASSALIAMTVLATPGLAREDGFYIGTGIGANLSYDQQTDVRQTTNSLETDLGPGALLNFGYKYEENWRAEVEGGYRTTGISGINELTGNGDVDTWTLIINGLYDFENDSFITPYIGVGAGVAILDYDNVTPVRSDSGATSLNDSGDPNLALQFIAGAAWEIADNVELTGQYNFLAVPEMEARAANGLNSRGELYNHMLTVGLRYTFPVEKSRPERDPNPFVVEEAAAVEPKPEIAAAAPPPAPPPPPEEPVEITRNFIVYFDWDKSALTPASEAILRQASAFARQGNVARIILTGHADRSGASAYNDSLSQARADQVRNKLIELGEAAGSIVTFARGESEPLVSTEDGVREPQNRRVEIVLE